MMNRKGFALSTVLIFSAVMLILAVSMFIVVNKNTRFSGDYRTFNSVKEAADTGINIGINLIENYKNNDPGAGISVNELCGKKFGEYLISVDPNDSTCLNELKNNPWINITENNINLKIYIIKEYQSFISGVGGVASFSPTAGSNIRRYAYYFKIISVAENLNNNQKIVGEALYRFSK